MDNMISEILSDLYAADNSLKAYEKELKDAIKKLLENKPETRFDEAFKTRLRGELLSKIEAIKQAQPAEAQKASWFGRLSSFFPTISRSGDPAVVMEEKDINEKKGRLRAFGLSSLPFSLPALVVAVVILLVVSSMAMVGWDTIQQGGGKLADLLNFSQDEKGETQFAFEPTIQDPVGVDPHSAFVLSSSAKMSEKKVRQIVTFEPKVAFTVKELGKTSSLIPSAYASAEDRTMEYRYEIKVSEPLKENVVYKVSIKDTSVADREYQWAFQVKAPFGILETTPADKAVSVPTNSAVEIVFNRQLTDETSRSFSIEPKAEGRFEIVGDKLTFIPQSLQERTVYEVRIEKGLRSKDGEELDKEHGFYFETAGNSQVPSETFQLFDDLMSTTPTATPLINISNFSSAASKYEVAVYVLGGADEFMESYNSSQHWDFGWTNYSKEKPIDSYKPSASKQIFSAGLELVSNPNGPGYLILPQNLDEGYYFVTVRNGDTEQAGWMQSSQIVHYYSLTQKTGFIWLSDNDKKTPVAGADIKFIGADGKEKTLAATDKDGLGKFSVPAELQEEISRPLYLKISGAGYKNVALLVGDPGYSFHIDRGDRFWDYISTDRYYYNPTDTISYWGVMKGRGTELKDQELTVGLYNTYNEYEVDERADAFVLGKAKVSGNYTVEGKLEFKGLNPGWYNLVLSDQDHQIVGEASIEVQTYTKPAYQITVTPTKQALFVGDTVEFKVKAEFYDGTPASGLKMEYYGAGDRKLENFQGEIILDQFGEGKVVYQPEYHAPDYDAEHFYYYNEYPLTFNLTVSPAGSEEAMILGEAGVDVFGPEYLMETSQECQQQQPCRFVAQVNKVDLGKLVTEDETYFYDQYKGEPAAGVALAAKVVKETQVKKEIGDYYDPITKTTSKQFEYETKSELVEETGGQTGINGQWTFSRDFPKEEGVSYKILIEGQDGQGRQFADNIYASVENFDRGQGTRLNVSGGSESSMGRREYAPGEAIKMELEVLYDNKPERQRMLVYRYQNDIDSVAIVDGYKYEEKFSELMAPSVQYAAVIFGPYGVDESNHVMAKMRQEEKKLTVDIKPDKEKYQPGDEANLRISVKDNHGQPVQGEVNISVIDEALFADQWDWNGEILDELYMEIFIHPTVGFTRYAIGYLPEGGGGGGGERNTFLDVVAFTSVQTDSDGEAIYTMAIPDNITSWRVSARAFDQRHMQAGQQVELVPVSLPFFVDTTLGSTYLTGDSPEIRARVFGEAYQPGEPVSYFVESQSLDISKEFQMNEPIAYISLGTLPFGDHDLTVTAKQGSRSDTVVRKIKVIGGYSRKTVSKVYPLSDQMKNIEGSQDGYTKLVFVDQGRGRFYQTLADHAYADGLRSDQVVAGYYSRQALAVNFEKEEFKEQLNIEGYYPSDGSGPALPDRGGVSLFPYGSRSLELSAKVADVAKEVVSREDMAEYFYQIIYDKNADIHRVSKALYGLASVDEPVLPKIRSAMVQTELTLEDKIYLALALFKAGDVEGSRQYYEEEIHPALTFEGDQALIKAVPSTVDQTSDPAKLTATTGLLAAYVGSDDTGKLWNYISTHDPVQDLDVLEEVMIAKTELAKNPSRQAQFELKTKDRKDKISLDRGAYEITLSNEELMSLSFQNVKGAIDLVSVYEIERRTANIKNDPALKITRDYLVGGQTATTFKEGDDIQVSLLVQIDQTAADGQYQIIDALPSGMKPATALFEPFLRYDHSDVDFCRMTWHPNEVNGNVSYFTFDKDYAQEKGCGDSFTIVYNTRVVSKGKFRADAAGLQSLGDLERYYFTPETTVEIK